ncbi:MAG: IclR family transcriptional regulator [Actinomycetota bacterium]
MPGAVQSIERAAAVLRLLAGNSGRLSLAEVSHSLDLAKATTHGILRTLQGVGFVEQDNQTGRYQLGAVLLHLGSSYLDVNELRARATNWADALASRSGESVRIGAPLGAQVIVVHHVFRPDDSMQTLDVGALLPAHATAVGKVLLAYLPSMANLDLDLGRYTRRTITTRRGLTRTLLAVRAAGWASEIEEMLLGQASIAAPIRGQGGLVVGSIAICGSPERLCSSQGVPRPHLVAAVNDTARAISRQLGGHLQ